MMPRPIADCLIDFGPPGEVKITSKAPPSAAGSEAGDGGAAENLAFALQRAREEGFAQGLAEAQHRCEGRLAQQTAAFEARLAAERGRWVQEQSELLGARIEAALSTLESNIAASVERLLQPFLIESLRARTIALLAEHIKSLLGGRERPLIEIRGPDDLLGLLRKRLPALTGTIAYFPDESIEVQVVAGQTVIETQIGAWAARIGLAAE